MAASSFCFRSSEAAASSNCSFAAVCALVSRVLRAVLLAGGFLLLLLLPLLAGAFKMAADC